MPNTDTFAANHGQNRSRGRAVRSDSSMISMPVVSTPSRRVCSSPDAGVVVLLMTASYGRERRVGRPQRGRAPSRRAYGAPDRPLLVVRRAARARVLASAGGAALGVVGVVRLDPGHQLAQL